MADMNILDKSDRDLSTGYMMWYRFSRNPAAVIGSLILLSVLILAVFAPWLTPYPKHIGAVVDFRARHMPPDLDHWFGTDKAGRDIFSRTWHLGPGRYCSRSRCRLFRGLGRKTHQRPDQCDAGHAAARHGACRIEPTRANADECDDCHHASLVDLARTSDLLRLEIHRLRRLY